MSIKIDKTLFTLIKRGKNIKTITDMSDTYGDITTDSTDMKTAIDFQQRSQSNSLGPPFNNFTCK